MFRIVLLTLFASVVAVQRLLGRCDIDNLDYLTIDDVAPFAGKIWYLYATYGSEWIGGDCPTGITYLDPVHPNTTLGRDVLFVENGNTHNNSRPIVVHNGYYFKQNFYPFIEEESKQVKFYALDADVDGYALLYACVEDTPYTKIVNAEFFTFMKTESSEINAQLQVFSQKYEELKQDNWVLHDHTNCPF